MKLPYFWIVSAWALFCFPAKGDIEISGFEDLALDLSPQKDPVACWAASMSAALKAKGVNLTQDAIREAVNNSPEMSTLTNPFKLTFGMNRLAFGNRRFSGTFVSSPGYSISWPAFKREINEGNPILLGYWLNSQHQNAHCVLIYGANTDSLGRPIEYKVWDPEPGAGINTLPVSQLDVWFFVIVEGAHLNNSNVDNNIDNPQADDTNEDIPRASTETIADLSAKIQQILNSYSQNFASISGEVTKENEIAKISRCTIELYAEKASVVSVKTKPVDSNIIYVFDDQEYAAANHKYYQLLKSILPYVSDNNAWGKSIKILDDRTMTIYTEKAGVHRRVALEKTKDNNVVLKFDYDKPELP